MGKKASKQKKETARKKDTQQDSKKVQVSSGNPEFGILNEDTKEKESHIAEDKSDFIPDENVHDNDSLEKMESVEESTTTSVDEGELITASCSHKAQNSEIIKEENKSPIRGEDNKNLSCQDKKNEADFNSDSDESDSSGLVDNLLSSGEYDSSEASDSEDDKNLDKILDVLTIEQLERKIKKIKSKISKLHEKKKIACAKKQSVSDKLDELKEEAKKKKNKNIYNNLMSEAQDLKLSALKNRISMYECIENYVVKRISAERHALQKAKQQIKRINMSMLEDSLDTPLAMP